VPGGSAALAAHQVEGRAAGSVEETDQPEQMVVVVVEEDGSCNAVGAVAVEVAAAAAKDGGPGGAVVAAVADVAAELAAAVPANGVQGGGAAVGMGSEMEADDGHHAAIGRMAVKAVVYGTTCRRDDRGARADRGAGEGNGWTKLRRAAHE
jgi:hypothetical protein